jgi:hypothetical protein
MRAFLFTVLFLSLSSLTFGQSVAKDEWAIELPPSYTELVLIKDPKCPIQLSPPIRIIGWDSGGLSLDFQIQNVSKANVVSYEIQEWNWYGSSGYEATIELPENIFFVPLMTISSKDTELLDGLAAFDLKKVEKQIPPKLNRVWVAIVTKVKLSDGTTYDASKKYSRLLSFLDEMYEQERANGYDEDQRRNKLLSFTASLFSTEK